MMRSLLGAAALTLVLLASGCSQAPQRSEALLDSGRSLTPAMQAYRVDHYTLRHDILVDERAIAGSATIAFVALDDLPVLELDFDGSYRIESIRDTDGPLAFERDPERLRIDLGEVFTAGRGGEVTVTYRGRPRVAPRAPWDGGFVWETTPAGAPWIATAIQGEGCDIWWPCKDHPVSEAASADLYFAVPGDLVAVSNGRLIATREREDGFTEYHWRTEYPTNRYGFALNVAPYVELRDDYQSVTGQRFPVIFWVIPEHEDDARKLFEREFPATIEFFERRLGPYPWPGEKLGVAETPHLGMEHQTVNAYGNEFRRDRYGFDWLFHHELAHEWFGNLMSVNRLRDMWLHEGLGAYMQDVYTQEVLGDAAFHARMFSDYHSIRACQPIVPAEDLSDSAMFNRNEDDAGPGGDIYSRGAWVAQSLRWLIGEEAFWRSIKILLYDTPHPENLRAPFPTRFRTTEDFELIASAEADMNLDWFFEVYTRRADLPLLEVEESDAGVTLRWRVEDDFPMPVPVMVNGIEQRIDMADNTALLAGVGKEDVQIDPFMRILRKLPTVPTCEERLAEEAEENSD